MEKLDPSEIYDPNSTSLPKTKHIFKITKAPRNRSLSNEPLMGSSDVW